jgi:hypothetical protein
MTTAENDQLNAAPSGILVPWNWITKPAIERYRPVMRGSTDGCLSPSARQEFIADRSAPRVRQSGASENRSILARWVADPPFVMSANKTPRAFNFSMVSRAPGKKSVNWSR